MKGWTCEEWMDWLEADSAFALINLRWQPEHAPAQQLFQKMWGLLRGIVLHYMRPRPGNDTSEAVERVRTWGQKYAALAEQVSNGSPPPTS